MGVPFSLAADGTGRVFDFPRYRAVGRCGRHLLLLRPEDLIPLPRGSEIFSLPGRAPLGLRGESGRIEPLSGEALSPLGEALTAVAAFLPPAFTVTHGAAFSRFGAPERLPLFSYAALAWWRGGYHAAGVRVDRDRRQDIERMDGEEIRTGVLQIREEMKGNRLAEHLSTCALRYGCPAAKNFFLGRYEAPLPSSPRCNALCAGCISYQPGGDVPPTQPRLAFSPTPEEMAEVALHHLRVARRPVVSFGQGCEGEPLLRWRAIQKAIRLIRKGTGKGTIHLNTNGSLPEAAPPLVRSGLDSVRVSLNSVRGRPYEAYYKPRGYRFRDVLGFIEAARKEGAYVSLNLLVFPGFTDSPAEVRGLRRLIETGFVDMVQFRNLNCDPDLYARTVGLPRARDAVGIRALILLLRDAYPGLRIGYFNPPKERF